MLLTCEKTVIESCFIKFYGCGVDEFKHFLRIDVVLSRKTGVEALRVTITLDIICKRFKSHKNVISLSQNAGLTCQKE